MVTWPYSKLHVESTKRNLCNPNLPRLWVGQRATDAGSISMGIPPEEKDKGPNKGDILNGAVSWTRDLMWALHVAPFSRIARKPVSYKPSRRLSHSPPPSLSCLSWKGQHSTPSDHFSCAVVEAGFSFKLTSSLFRSWLCAIHFDCA